MGDLLFVLRMVVYTFFIVILMQIKIGSGTIEEKIIQWTHHSQIAGSLQGMAQGAVVFMGKQYNSLAGHFNSNFLNKHSATQRRGERLKAKIGEIRENLESHWEKNEKYKKDENIEE